MKTPANHVIALLSLLLTGCSSVSYFTIPVYKPANHLFPATGSSVVIVNNAVEQNPHIGSTVIFDNGTVERVSLERDSITPVLVSGIADHFYNSGLFSDVLIYNDALRTDSLWYTTRPLSGQQIDTIAAQSGAEWILSLESLTYQITIKETFEKEINMKAAKMQSILRPYFCLYKTDTHRIEKKYVFTDTLYWHGYAYDFLTAMMALPDIGACLTDASALMAEYGYKQWLPHETEETRYFISSNDVGMREAQRLLNEVSPEDACYMWEYVYETNKNKRTRLYAAYNIAVFRETLNEYGNAIDWLNKCLALNTDKEDIERLNIAEYLSSLNKRRNEQNILESQGVVF